ncbi:pilus assembly protein [Thalassotalea atypica]|uniref:pilus assembly protein n=1 Tax=Thalassotalea atypica TaxID=2054316 RepID=UPI0025729A5C|nr:PilC/PilY family type IV pilus protein [Thalassotalea atypica]
MKKLLFLCSALLPILVAAEDIELYLGNESVRVGAKPKILIIFDNSGSMKTEEVTNEKYDPTFPYPATGGFNSLSDKFVYFTKGVGLDGATLPVPDSPSEQRRFLEEINSCEAARTALNTVGFFTGYIREYAFSGNSGSWQEIPDNNGANIEVIDCLEDIQAEDPTNKGIDKDGNKIDDGYPVDGEGTKKNPIYHNADITKTNTAMGLGEVVTLYSDNYLRYKTDPDIAEVNLSRLEIAQEAMSTVIRAFPGVEFGLQIFNHNHEGENTRDGGRIVAGIGEMTPDNEENILDIINNQLDPETNTPLCESLYEALQYFAGNPVYYGDDDSNRGGSYTGNTPPRDTSIEEGGSYISPFQGCGDDVYVILMTDGAPTMDAAANGLVAALPGMGAPMDVDGTDNYLAALAGWMRTNDINSTVDETQTSQLTAIGFGLATCDPVAEGEEDTCNGTDIQEGDSDAVKLLKTAGKNGGGGYYNANNPDMLLNSLVNSIIEILKEDSSFTAPSVASNNFDRTETLDSVYYAMFTPDKGPRWPGNLKKLELSGTKVVDGNGDSAIDSNGNIDSDAQTIWSSTKDGGQVSEGGVVEMFSKMQPSTRKVYSDLGTGGAFKLLTKANAASALGGNTELANALGVAEVDIDSNLNWALGYDVDNEDKDNSTTDMRKDVFGDPLHSKPLVINYGGTENNQKLRIIVGTNAGAIHMFDDAGTSVSEQWAFMPKEFFGNYAKLRENSTSSDKIYGVDGTAVAYILDKNGDGSVTATDGDKAWVFVGLRRGGSSYYAIDVSYPDSPSLMWKIDESTGGFSEMGQSWSTPRVSFSHINKSGDVGKPVLIFGAGYSTAKDTAGVGTDDLTGRGMYMVDAEEGTLLWSMTPSTTPAFPGVDSVPSAIAVMDSDSDSFTDRLYVGDTGGMVWRIDMPNATTSDWNAVKLASLGSDDVELNDRRFFAEPTIARALITETFTHKETDEDGNETITTHQTQVPYDAVLIGSGDRTSPLDSNTLDKLFMIKDENIITQKFETAPTTIVLDDLYNYTNNPFEGLDPDSAAYKTLALDVSTHKGWFVDLETSGEKSVAKPEAIAGVAYFNAFYPANEDDNVCKIEGGEAHLYAMDLALGINIYSQRKLETPGIITDKITIITVDKPTDPDDDTESNKVVGNPLATLTGDPLILCDADGNCEGINLKTMRSHVVVTELD